MKLLILLNLFVIASGAWGHEPPYPVLRFKFEVNPKNMSQLLGEIIDSERYATYNQTIPAKELLLHTNIHELSLAQWTDVCAHSKLNFSNINVEKLMEITRTLHINTIVEYREFMKLVADPLSQLKSALMAINVDETKLMYYTMMNEVGDEHFFDEFQAANFSNLPKALSILQLSNEQIFHFGKACILNYLNNITLYDFGRLMKNITGEVQSFHVGYEKEQVGILKSLFDVLEAYPEGSFLHMLETYNKGIVSPKILATRVKTNTYLSSGSMYKDIQRMSELYTKPFLMEGQKKFEVTMLSFNGSLAEIKTIDEVVFPERNGLVSQFQRCLYAQNENTTVVVTVSYSNAEMYINKGTNVEFIMGAPLFCDSQLVGVALKDNLSSILFAKVHFKMAAGEVVAAVKPPPALPPPLIINITSEYITRVHFKLIEAKIPSLIGYLLMDTVNGNRSQINTDGLLPMDVIQSFQLEALTYLEFSQLHSKHASSSSGINGTINLLKTFNASTLEIFNQLTSRLNQTQLDAILSAVNISAADLQRLKFYQPNNEEKFRELIFAGNFIKSNIEKALKVANLTDAQLYDIIKPAIFQAVKTSTTQKVLQLINHFGGYPALNKHTVTQNIQPSAVTTNDGYQRILRDFDARLKNSSALAPVISRSNVLTANDVYEDFNDPTTKEFVSLEVQTANQTYSVSTITAYTSGYSNLTLETLLPAGQLSLSIATDSQPKLCKLVTDTGVYEAPRVANIRDGFEIILDDDHTPNNIPRHLFKLGAGLVCHGHLYGVATRLVTIAALERIQFAGVKDGVKPIIIIDKPEKEHPSKGAGNTFSYNALILAVCVILAFLGL